MYDIRTRGSSTRRPRYCRMIELTRFIVSTSPCRNHAGISHECRTSRASMERKASMSVLNAMLVTGNKFSARYSEALGFSNGEPEGDTSNVQTETASFADSIHPNANLRTESMLINEHAIISSSTPLRFVHSSLVTDRPFQPYARHYAPSASSFRSARSLSPTRRRATNRSEPERQ